MTHCVVVLPIFCLPLLSSITPCACIDKAVSSLNQFIQCRTMCQFMVKTSLKHVLPLCPEFYHLMFLNCDNI